MIDLLDIPGDASRRDTTLVKWAYLGRQAPLGIGHRGWVHRAMQLRVAESRADRALVATVVKRRHLHGCWPCRPKTLILSYLADLAGAGGGPAGAAGMVMVALMRALGLAQYEVLTLVRMWRADDLGPQLTPDFTPELLRRVVRGERSRGPLGGVRAEWIARKCRAGGLRAAPRLLVTYADPAAGHDGATYLAAGARFCGKSASGKLLFAWGLDDEMRALLERYSIAVCERLRA